jgi:hypothetical protein
MLNHHACSKTTTPFSFLHWIALPKIVKYIMSLDVKSFFFTKYQCENYSCLSFIAHSLFRTVVLENKMTAIGLEPEKNSFIDINKFV